MPHGTNIEVNSVRGRPKAFFQAEIGCKRGFNNPDTMAKWITSNCLEDGTWSQIPECTGMNSSFETHSLKIVSRQTSPYYKWQSLLEEEMDGLQHESLTSQIREKQKLYLGN